MLIDGILTWISAFQSLVYYQAHYRKNLDKVRLPRGCQGHWAAWISEVRVYTHLSSEVVVLSQGEMQVKVVV